AYADLPLEDTDPDGRLESMPKLTLSFAEVDALMAAGRPEATRLAPAMGARAAVRGGNGHLRAETVRFTSRDLFALFRLDFARGGPWTTADDTAGNPVVVIDKTAACELFGQDDPIGRTVTIDGTALTVVGVLASGGREKLYDQVYYQHEVESFFVPYA